jgi:hypothetical protein
MKLILLLLLLLSFSGCRQERAKEPPKAKSESLYGESIRKSKELSSSEIDRQKEVDDQLDE